MLNKINRVRKQKEYDRIFAKNKKVRSQNFQILIHYSKDLLEPKIGIIVSSKVGKAVVRNKTKRRIREVVRANLNKLPNAEYVIITYPQIATLNFESLKKEIETAINNISNQSN